MASPPSFLFRGARSASERNVFFFEHEERRRFFIPSLLLGTPSFALLTSQKVKHFSSGASPKKMSTAPPQS